MAKHYLPRGEGSVYECSNGYWRAVLPPTKESGGKPKYFSAKSEKEIMRKVNEYKGNMPYMSYPKFGYKFKDYISNWLFYNKVKKIKPTSFDRIQSSINNHIIPSIGEINIYNISSDLIQNRVIDKMFYDGLSYSSIKKVYDILCMCFKYAVSSGVIEKDPMTFVLLPQKEVMNKRTIQIMTDKEIESFKDICLFKINDTYKYRYGFAFIIMLNSGLRASEMLALSWSDVNLHKRQIEVNYSMVSAKDRQEYVNDVEEYDIKINYKTIQQSSSRSCKTLRCIPINDMALWCFKELLDLQEKLYDTKPKYVVCKDFDSPVSISSFTKSFISILDKANIEHSGFSVLRHTFVSKLINKGVDIKEISDLLGYGNSYITYETYEHLLKEKRYLKSDLLNF